MSRFDKPDRLLGRLELPVPPADLEARSLAAARTAMARPTARPDLWTRLWESRPARLAWAGAVAGLLVGHALLSLPRHQATTRPRPYLVLAGTIPDAELAAVVELPRLRSDRLPQLDAAVKPRPAAPADLTSPRRASHDA